MSFLFYWIQETDRLSVLNDSLARSDQITDQMNGVLTSFEDRLKRLEDTITPVYQETRTLQCRHESIFNIDWYRQ